MRRAAIAIAIAVAALPYYRVDVRDTKQLEFGDMPFRGGPLRERGAFGAIAKERATEISRAIVRAFFDHELNGRPSPLLEGRPVFVEATVRRILPPVRQ